MTEDERPPAVAARPVDSPQTGRFSRGALAVHLATLGVALVILAWINRHQWFILDEWDMLVDRGFRGRSLQGPLEPHNEHWATLPVIVYRALFSVFGVRTYAPYLAVLYVVHLGTAHLLWRVMGRAGVGAWFATPSIAVFTVLGVGWENLTQAFQWCLIASVGFGLAAILIAPERGRFDRRDIWAWVLLVLGLMSSGVGITMVGIAGLVALVRRGWRMAAMVVSVPAGVYLVWFALWGSDAPDKREPLTTALRTVPSYVWHGFTDAVGGVVDNERLGPFLIVALAIAIVATVRPRDPSWVLPLALAVGAVVFLALVTVRRSGLGVDTAGDSRYAYIVIALLLPLAAKVLQSLLGWSRIGIAVYVVAAVVLFGIQVRVLNDTASDWAKIEQDARRRTIAAAELLADDVRPITGAAPVPEWAPNLGVRDVRRLDREGQLPGGVETSEADRLTTRAFMQIRLDRDPYANEGDPPSIVSTNDVEVAPAGTDCIDVLPSGPGPAVTLRFTERGRLEIEAEEDGILSIAALGTGSDVGRDRLVAIPGGSERFLSVSDALTFRMGLPPGFTTICGVDADI